MLCVKGTSIERRVREDLQDSVPVVRSKRKLIPKPGAQNSRSAEYKASVSRSDKEPAFARLKLVVTRVLPLPYLEHRRRDAAKCDFDPKLRIDRLACPAPEDDFARWCPDHDFSLWPATGDHGSDERHWTICEPLDERWWLPTGGYRARRALARRNGNKQRRHRQCGSVLVH
jgi:hypothetical protein